MKSHSRRRIADRPSTRKLSLALVTSLLAASCAGSDEIEIHPEPLEPAPPPPAGDAAVAFDVSEDMFRFIFSEAPVFDDGLPAHGNSFVTSGYLYPFGFLDEQGGVQLDGTPSSPERVLGEWTCRGWMIGDGAHTATGPIVVTTQLYDVYAEPGYAPGKPSTRRTLVTDGYELADVGEPALRTVSGGTGPYRGARGQMEQVLLGLNASQGVDLRVRFELD